MKMTQLVLNGIDPVQLIHRYQTNTETISSLGKKKASISTYDVGLRPTRSPTTNTRKFMLDSRITYALTEVLVDFNCMYCLKPSKSTEFIGIPVGKTINNGEAVYTTIDAFCSYACTNAELAERQQNLLYTNSEFLLFEMFEIETGKSYSEMPKSEDRRMLQIFNGNLTYERFHQLKKTTESRLSFVKTFRATEFFTNQ